MPDVYVRLREGGVEGGAPIPADGRVRLTPVLVPDPDAWVTSAPTVLTVVGGVAEPVAVSPGRWRVDVVSESWARRWELDIVESAEPVNLVTLVPVDPATPVPWLPTEADLVFIRETRERIPELIEAAVAEGDYTGPAGRGVVSIADDDGDGTATVTYSDGTTGDLPLPSGRDGEDGADGVSPPPPSVLWDGPVLVVGDQRSPDLTGPPGRDGVDGDDGAPGPPGAVPTAADYVVAGPGRPDAPTTTGMSSAALDALPVGAEYRSTDGAGTGAWVWRKRPTGWVVTDGDTGWRDVTTLGDPELWKIGASNHTARVRIRPGMLDMNMSLESNSSQRIKPIPIGFTHQQTGELDPISTLGGANWYRLIFSGGDLATVEQPSKSLVRTLRSIPFALNQWPSTLPGTPA